MAIFNVPRAGRKNADYAEKLLGNMFMDERQIFKQGFGVCLDNPECILHSFESVRNTYCKINPVKVHYMEIYIAYEQGKIALSIISNEVGRYLYEKGFQSFISVTDTGSAYLIAIAVNAVSFITGELFKDNNAHYQEIFKYLRGMVPVKWDLQASDNTFFDPDRRDGNYVHGNYA